MYGLLGSPCLPAPPSSHTSTSQAARAPLVARRGALLAAALAWAPAARAEDRELVSEPNGLITTELRAGEGPVPRTGDIVAVHVRGFLADDTLFEDTRAAGSPLVFTAGIQPRGLCDGLERAILHAHAGSLFLLVVPPALGFGPRGGAGSLRRVPGNATLRYEVELLRCGGAGDAGLACCSQPDFAGGACAAPPGFSPEAAAGALAQPPSVNALGGLE